MDENKQFPFINRELSWMDFNWRVLEEAFEKENPVMERLRFLGITSSNLDEFFMVRVAGVKAQVHSGYKTHDLSGLPPDEPESGGSPEGRGGIPVRGGTGAVDSLPLFAGTRPGAENLCAAREYYLL